MSLLDLFTKSQSTPQASSQSDERMHITQEMYKKNFELAEINKTLSLLRKIDVIVLSSVTDVNEVAQQIANTIVKETSFLGIVVYLFDTKKENLVPIALSESTENISFQKTIHPHITQLSMSSEENLIVKTAKLQTKQSTVNLSDLFLPAAKEQSAQVQTFLKIKSILSFPITVRNEFIGVLTVMLGEDEMMLTDHQKDLLERMVGTTGIALDNAMLFDDLQATTTKLKEANDTLQKLDELKDEFVSLASHELRTPMTVIKSYLWSLEQGKSGELNEKQRLYVQRALTSTDRLINLVNDMLNVSRIESGRFTLDLKSTNMNELVNDVVEEMRPRAEELGVELVTDITAENPQATIDPDRIKQVLINLVGNSLKFTPQGGKVTVISAIKGDRIVMQVADTGVGIEKEDMPKLFRKFGMVGNNYLTKQATQGTGLGLYLSKSIVELHNGRMLVVSEGRGKGSTFTFYLQSDPKLPPHLLKNTEQSGEQKQAPANLPQ